MRNSYNAVLMVMALLFWGNAAAAQNMPAPAGSPASSAAPATIKSADLIVPSAANDNGARLLMQFAANNDPFDHTISETAKDLYHYQIAECKSVDQAVRQLPTPYGGLTFPATDSVLKFPAPISGLWVEHVKIRGCGKIYQMNMMGIGQQGGLPPIVLGLLPGETLSDPGQQGNILRMSIQSIRRADANCSDDPKPLYTALLGYKQPDGSLAKTDAKLGWFEEWRFQFCQKEIPAQVAFLPDGAGGYDIKTRIVGDVIPSAPTSKPDVPGTQQKAAPTVPAAAPLLPTQ